MIKLIVFSLLGKEFKRPELIFTMIKAYLVIYMLILPSFMNAQNFQWIQSYQTDYSLNPEFANYLVSGDQNGNIYWGGLFMYHEHYSLESFGDLVFYKLDEAGNTNDQFFCYGNGSVAAMANDNEGNLIVHFHLRSDLLLDSSDTLHYSGNSIISYLVKLNSEFDLLWKQPYDNNGFSLSASMVIDQNNNILIGVHESQNTQILILDPNGIETGQIMQENVNRISSIANDMEGNIYAAGSCASPGATFGGVNYEPEFSYTNYLVKYSSNYQAQWVKFVEDVTCPFLMVACNDPDHVYFAGQLHIETNFDDIVVDGPNWVFDFYIARLNEDGEFQWVNEIPNTVITGDGSIGKMNYLGIDQNNNPYIAGFIRGDIDWGNGLISESTDIGYDLMALKYNPDGELIYEKTAGGMMFDKAVSSYLNTNGDFYLAGFGSDTIILDTITHYQDGFYYPFLTKISEDDINTGLDRNNTQAKVELFPNPITDKLNVRIDGTNDESIALSQILDINGTIVSEYNNGYTNEIEMQTDNLVSGIYFLFIKTTKNQTYRQKIIKL